MEIKTINFIFALIAGKATPGYRINISPKNIWNDKKAVDFFVSHFIVDFFPRETTVGVGTSYFHLLIDYNNTAIRQRKKQQKGKAFK